MATRFEKIEGYQFNDFNLPERKTKFSAGYDFEVPEDILIPSHLGQLFNMVKSRMADPVVWEEIEELSLTKQIMELGASAQEGIGEMEKMRLMRSITKSLPEVLELFQGIFTMELEDAKDMIDIANARATIVPTGVKVYLEDDQQLELFVRSSSAIKGYLFMSNSVGIIDSDYVDNPQNEGHIGFPIINLSPFNILLKKGDIIGQGIISRYEVTNDDSAEGERLAGFGHTTKK